MVLETIMKEKLVSKKLGVADVSLPQNSPGQESEELSPGNAVSISRRVTALTPTTRG